MLSNEELKEIAPYYRWLIKLLPKIPNLHFPDFLLNKFPEIEGIFWIFMATRPFFFFANLWLVIALSVFPFPFNLAWLLVPSAIFVFFIRVQLERAVALWRSIERDSLVREWRIPEVTDELVEIFKKQQRKKSG